MKRIFISLFILPFLMSTLNAQNTFDRVYTILQTNCQGSSCHGGNNPQVFDVSGSKSAVYNALVEIPAVNSIAAAKGDMLVDRGYPSRSFLLRKIAHGLSHSQELALEAGEGDLMPTDSTALSETELEIIRQWIFRGAPQTGVVADETLITDYYTNGGKAMIPQPAAPNPSEGFQMRMGPIFFDIGEEREFFRKFEIDVPVNTEVNRMEVIMNDESHHFILYKFETPAASSGYAEGLRNFNLIDFFNNETDFVMAWQNDDNVELPEGTAYFWEAGATLDLNYHILNSSGQILPTDAYINIYTQPSGTAVKEMKSMLINNGALFINNNNQAVTFTDDVSWSGTRSIWNIVSHTHKYGIDYDVFLRQPNGSKGQQIYEGFYNFNYTFNQGFFEWDHPPVKYFEPLLEVDHGLIHEATFKNNGPRPVIFGFTTDDEMMIIYVQYVDGTYEIPVDTTATAISINEPVKNSGLSIYPNPFDDITTISYALPETQEVSLKVYNAIGEQMAIFAEGMQSAGDYQYPFDPKQYGFTSGVYIIQLSVGGKSITRKLVQY